MRGAYPAFQGAVKIVPNETIETKLVEVLGLRMEEERFVAIVGIPDQAKGEALVLLAARNLSLEEVRERLLAAGLPSLWIPRRIKRVEKIPILGSGKLDLGKCRELAVGG